MNKEIRVNGSINAQHKFLTAVYHNDFISIAAWYTLPIEFIKTIEGFGNEVRITAINRHDYKSDDKCWACGTPVQPGELFCNEECKSFSRTHDIMDAGLPLNRQEDENI